MSDQYLSCADGNCGYCYACWGDSTPEGQHQRASEEQFAAAIAGAKAEGMKEATAAIVAWLWDGGGSELEDPQEAAEAIERGDHLTEAGK